MAKILCRTIQEGPSVVPVDGLPCGVPGLAITRAQGATGYTITHMRSGSAVMWFPDTDPEGVLAAALKLAPLTDWTLSGKEVTASHLVHLGVHAVARDYGGQFYSHGRGAQDAEDIL